MPEIFVSCMTCFGNFETQPEKIKKSHKNPLRRVVANQTTIIIKYMVSKKTYEILIMHDHILDRTIFEYSI